MTEDLKQATLDRILDRGVDMTDFGASRHRLPECNTVCCLAGTIVQAAFDLGLDVLDAYHRADPLDYDCDAATPRTARRLWGDVYGEVEAHRLGFYEEEWGQPLGLVTASAVAWHLRGVDTPYGHYGPPQLDDDDDDDDEQEVAS
jgi:hypothetical protein